VRQCWHAGGRRWSIWSWVKGAPGSTPTQVTRRPYVCGSWRHEGPCRQHDAHVAFARIKEAAEGYSADGWCYLVLTLDRHGTYSGKRRWLDAREAYKELSRMSRNLMASLARMAKAAGWAFDRRAWCAVVEAHRSGWPHVNLMLHCPALAAQLRRERAEIAARACTAREEILARGELLERIVATGWGVQSTAEAARNNEALAGYLVKLAGVADQTTGELCKLTQLPLNAPSRFRRLRSGKGFLPPRRKSDRYTGTLIRHELDPQRSAWGAIPVHHVSADLARVAAACCQAEGEALSEGRGTVDLAPVTSWRVDSEHESLSLRHAEPWDVGADGPAIEPAWPPGRSDRRDRESRNLLMARWLAAARAAGAGDSWERGAVGPPAHR
jgi:hypothetical protein